MPISNLWKLDRIDLPSSVVFSALDNARYSPQVNELVERPAGHPHPMARMIDGMAPMVEFTTPALVPLLQNVPVGGLAVTSAIHAYLKQAAATTPVSRSSETHRRLTINEAVVYWTRITLPHRGRASADVMIAVNYDGTNDPFVFTGTVALAGNLSAPTYFVLGPWSINGTDIPGLQEVTIESGINLTRHGGAGEEFDTAMTVETTDPVITLRTLEAINWSTVVLRGLALNGTAGITGFARAKGATAPVANNQSAHIKFVGTHGYAHIVDTSGDGPSPISDTLRVGLHSGTDAAAPLVVSTGQTIA